MEENNVVQNVVESVEKKMVKFEENFNDRVYHFLVEEGVTFGEAYHVCTKFLNTIAKAAEQSSANLLKKQQEEMEASKAASQQPEEKPEPVDAVLVE